MDSPKIEFWAMTSNALNFELTFRDAGTLKKIFETLVPLVKDTPVSITDHGLSIETIDNGRIALISLHLPTQFFKNFRCERACSLGVRTASFLKVIKFCSNDDLVTLSQRSNSSDQLDILVESRKYSQTMNFSLRLFRSDADQIDVIRPEFDSTVSIDSSRFAGMVRDLMGIGKTCRIFTKSADTTVSFEVMGEDTKCVITLGMSGYIRTKEEDVGDDGDDGEGEGYGEVDIRIKNEVNKKYPLTYISNFAKAAPLSEKVVLELSDNSPMRLCFRIRNEGGGSLAFLLAYKVDDEDEEDGDEEGLDGDDI